MRKHTFRRKEYGAELTILAPHPKKAVEVLDILVRDEKKWAYAKDEEQNGDRKES